MLEVREANVRDADAIASVFYNAVHQINIKDYSPLQIETWAGSAPAPEMWRKRIGAMQVFVACRKGEVVGFAGFEADGHIDTLYVHPEHQGEGIASRLLERIEHEAEQTAASVLYTEASITARPFFERRGFSVVSEQEVERRGIGFRNYKMEKRAPWTAGTKWPPTGG